jgi:hypothetical protein
MVLVSAIATIAILVAGVASFPFVRAAAEAQSVGKLASLADITAAKFPVTWSMRSNPESPSPHEPTRYVVRHSSSRDVR